VTTSIAHAESASGDGFVHEALFYAGRDEFLDGTLAFVREGLAADEPTLVVVDPEKISALQAELAGDAALVLFADMAEVGMNPARIIPAWRDFVDGHGAGGRAVRGIGEPIWPGRSAAELVECQRHESLLNLAFAGAPAFRLLCPYDSDALPEDVLQEAFRSHHVLVDGPKRYPSGGYRGLEAIAAPFGEPLPEPPASAHEVEFESETLGATRQLVHLLATAVGLSTSKLHDLVLAVNEVTTNSVRHGGGRGLLRIWQDADSLVCEVQDGGRIDRPLLGRERPRSEQEGGRGHWLANQVCDLVQVRTFDAGNVVRLHMRLC
jgi:anti-sigma regulatory factor (Ser/Thr protein kinase)